MKKEKISVIVPCYNEERSIVSFYERIYSVFKKMKHLELELIYVDDGSSDQTLIQIKHLHKKDKRVRYISFSRNFGKEAGMYAGLSSISGDYAIIMDVDGQDPPEMIEKMYQILQDENCDCVALYTNSHEGYPFLRKIGTNLFYFLIGKISSVKQVPGARDCRLMKKKMVNAIVDMKEYNRYSKGIFNFVGFNTKWLCYEAPDRKEGTSKYSMIHLFRYALEAVVSFSTTPLVLSAGIGILLCLFAFIMVVVIVVKTLIWGDPVGGWPSLVCIIMFLSGIQLFFLGVIGLYLSKVYSEVKGRPIYIIKETEQDEI